MFRARLLPQQHKTHLLIHFNLQMLWLQVQVLPKASDEVLQEPSAARIMRLYSQPAALVFASSHMLATACAVTGAAAEHSQRAWSCCDL